MSYNDSAFYVAETNRKNRLKAPLKPFIGILSGRNGPLIKSNDNIHHIPSAWYNGIIVKTSNTAGQYCYDLSKWPLTQVIPFGTAGVATLFHVQMPKILYGVRLNATCCLDDYWSCRLCMWFSDCDYNDPKTIETEV